ncbi:MAG: glycosyltransferase involved in cell wall biosynthesis [Cryomorphaceae bacterium]|jgi:glycosyltransferase involved in cell wall biosynthesis
MKILYYSPHPQLKIDAPTGYGTHMREMISAWRKMGIEVKTFIAGDQGSESYGEARPSKFARFKKLVPAILWETLKDFQLIRFDKSLEPRLIALIKEFKPDLIYERVAYLQNSGVKTAEKMGIKHVSEINAPYPEERVYFSGESFLVSQAKDHERQILAKSDLVMVVSTDLKNHLQQKLTDIDSKIIVVSNCVNPAETNHGSEDVAAIREAYQLSGKTVIGFVGSIFPYHGVDLLIDAFAQLDNSAEARLLIVGDGEALPELKAKVRSLGILDRCIFTGSVPHREVYPLIETMDICVMPDSNWYGSPVKIFEYGLMKKPVIAPDLGPLRDVMTDGENGLLVIPNSKALKEALQQLVTNFALREKIAIAWHEKVLLEYTWDTAAKKVLKACT